MRETEVTVLVVTYRGRRLLGPCLDSLDAQTLPHRLLVVDNASDDGSAELLAARLAPDQILRLADNAGFAGGVAAALRQVSTRFVALLNDDAVAAPDWLSGLVGRAGRDPTAAAWTSLLVLADQPDVVNNAGVVLLRSGYGTDARAGSPVDAVQSAGPEPTQVFAFSGGAALLRTAALLAIGGFPAEFFLYYEDLDTSWRLRLAGWTIWLVPTARVRHTHSATADQRSDLFHFHNERNRLWTLVRCAPWPVAAGALLTFVATTASLTMKRLLLRAVPDAANFRPALRFSVLRSLLTSSGELLAARGRIGRTAVVDRRILWRSWSGSTPARPRSVQPPSVPLEGG